jgi:diguanylate cyclase (GGDEF)-like protein/PAS domain S-box-containing protein
VKEALRLDDSVLDAIFSAILLQNPTGRVLALSEDGTAVPLPDSVDLLQHTALKNASSVDGIVDIRDFAVARDIWEKAREVGAAQAYVHLASEAERRVVLYLVDVRHRHGVFMCVIADSHDHLLPELEQEFLRPRHCTARVDYLGAFLSVDAAAPRIWGWSVEEIVGNRTVNFLHPQDVPKAIANWVDMLTAPGTERRVRLRFRHRDGSWIWLEVTSHNRLDDPQYGCVLTDILDVGDEMATLEAFRRSEQSLLRLADALPLGVLQIDREHRVLYCNERLGQIVGRRNGSTAEDHLSNLAPSDCSQLDAALHAVLDRGEDEDIEVKLQHRRGVRHCSVALRALTDQSGGVTGAILCVGDVTEDVLMRQELRMRANYDRLTHCYNRVSILSSLDKVLLEACLGETGTGAIFVDLDHFKPINDELGHAAGDQLLTLIAERLLNTVRSDDRVGRFGGDEFLVVCPDVNSPEDALTIAGRLAEAIGQPLEISGRQVTPSASIGVSWSCNGADNAEALVARADAAMYRSKSERRGRPVLAASDALPEGRPSRRPRTSRLSLPANAPGETFSLTIDPTRLSQRK